MVPSALNKPILLALLGACCLAVSPQTQAASASHLSATPTDATIDAPVRIRLTGIKPGALVTVTAQMLDASQKPWRSSATFVASRRGVVDVRRTRSLHGTYTGVRAMGLFWSMLPVGWRGSPLSRSMFPATVSTVSIRARAHGRLLGQAQIVRRTTSPEVSIQEETLAAQGFIGRYCSKPSSAPSPAIVRIGGSEGGMPGDLTCTLLATHGFPTLDLAYFGLPGLPSALSRVPLEYFQRALQWLGRQPGVDASRLSVMGTSRGGEAALILGAVYPQYVHSVVGLVPSSNVNGGFGGPDPAWTLGGSALTFSEIPVERISGPVFVVGGGSDYVWPSGGYVRTIAKRMRAHGRKDVTALVYADAGHGLGIAVPNLRVGTANAQLNLGGSPSADARARAVYWPLLLKFLAKS